MFDTPGALFKQLQEWFGGESKYSSAGTDGFFAIPRPPPLSCHHTHGLSPMADMSADNLNLYSVYSYPNTVLCFFGGFIIDRLTGLRMGVRCKSFTFFHA